jgi:hypothetical protein
MKFLIAEEIFTKNDELGEETNIELFRNSLVNKSMKLINMMNSSISIGVIILFYLNIS